ncbi:hypothetical protein ACIGO6_23700 [Streptomyces sp. NPDC053750]|uniref:hypothetical protein n=1 Tax=Streptomyces sp. NPDC053750 TaxID=3365714 RepID=UPI0037D8F578
MKKRGMLAIASLATGFVVAAVSPSHATPGDLPLHLQGDPVGAVEDTVQHENLALHVDPLKQLG